MSHVPVLGPGEENSNKYSSQVTTPTIPLNCALLSTVGGSRAAASYVGVLPTYPVGLVARDPHVGHHKECAWLLEEQD